MFFKIIFPSVENELEIKQFSTLGKIILKNIYIAHYKLRILMKMIKTN
jgi:hypothetical protein